MSSINADSRVRRGARTALIAATMVSGLMGSTAALVMDAGSASAMRPPIKCKQTPDGNGCTHGADGTGGGTPLSVADLYNALGANSSSQDVFERKGGGVATSEDAAGLESELGYNSCVKSASAISDILCR